MAFPLTIIVFCEEWYFYCFSRFHLHFCHIKIPNGQQLGQWINQRSFSQVLFYLLFVVVVLKNKNLDFQTTIIIESLEGGQTEFLLNFGVALIAWSYDRNTWVTSFLFGFIFNNKLISNNHNQWMQNKHYTIPLFFWNKIIQIWEYSYIGKYVNEYNNCIYCFIIFLKKSVKSLAFFESNRFVVFQL